MSESERDRVNAEDLIAKNPGADADVVREALDLVEKLGEEGVPDAEYNIASPYQTFPRRAPAS